MGLWVLFWGNYTKLASPADIGGKPVSSARGSEQRLHADESRLYRVLLTRTANACGRRHNMAAPVWIVTDAWQSVALVFLFIIMYCSELAYEAIKNETTEQDNIANRSLNWNSTANKDQLKMQAWSTEDEDQSAFESAALTAATSSVYTSLAHNYFGWNWDSIMKHVYQVESDGLNNNYWYNIQYKLLLLYSRCVCSFHIS